MVDGLSRFKFLKLFCGVSIRDSNKSYILSNSANSRWCNTKIRTVKPSEYRCFIVPMTSCKTAGTSLISYDSFYFQKERNTRNYLVDLSDWNVFIDWNDASPKDFRSSNILEVPVGHIRDFEYEPGIGQVGLPSKGISQNTCIFEGFGWFTNLQNFRREFGHDLFFK